MSASDQTRRFRNVRDMSGLPQTSDIAGPGRHFAFGPKVDINCRDCDVRSLAEPEPDRHVFRQVQALVAQGRRALGRNHLRHNRRNPPSIYAQPNAPTISETQAMPNPKRIML